MTNPEAAEPWYAIEEWNGKRWVIDDDLTFNDEDACREAFDDQKRVAEIFQWVGRCPLRMVKLTPEVLGFAVPGEIAQ
jgi:hypothetical protein